jgi:hypothetical protein
MSTKKPQRQPGQFVKSWDTSVPVGQTKAALEELLKRYGATGFTVSEDYESRTVAVVFFLRARPDEDPIEIRLPIGYRQVLDRLRRMREFQTKCNARSSVVREEWAHDQAARVAWRHVYLWADAALSAVDAGLYSLPEAFFAHAMIDAPGGHRVRAIDAVTALKLLPRAT